MWLPASYFNRAIHFESLSKFGRKRKHKIDPDVERKLPNKRRKALTNEGKQGTSSGKTISRRKGAAKTEKKHEKKLLRDSAFE